MFGVIYRPLYKPIHRPIFGDEGAAVESVVPGGSILEEDGTVMYEEDGVTPILEEG